MVHIPFLFSLRPLRILVSCPHNVSSREAAELKQIHSLGFFFLKNSGQSDGGGILFCFFTAISSLNLPNPKVS